MAKKAAKTVKKAKKQLARAKSSSRRTRSTTALKTTVENAVDTMKQSFRSNFLKKSR
jgi:hypothetical protein